MYSDIPKAVIRSCKISLQRIYWPSKLTMQSVQVYPINFFYIIIIYLSLSIEHNIIFKTTAAQVSKTEIQYAVNENDLLPYSMFEA